MTALAAILVSLFACGPGPVESTVAEDPPLGPEPASVGPQPVLRRLTVEQYHNSVGDVLGPGLVLPSSLEPDVALDGLFSVGASQTTISARGVEQYEAAAFSLAEQALDRADLRATLVPCVPAGVRDDGCAAQALEPLGLAAWRRPLSAEELAGLVEVAGTASEVLGDFDAGLEFGVAYLLQSPWFLYRVELGEEAEGGRVLTDWELATRLSYFLWNTTPDQELLQAAAAGDLSTEAGLEAQVARLLASDRARVGVRSFFTEMLQLWALDTLTKDPNVFVYMSPELGPSAREETLLGIDWLVFEEDADLRSLLTTTRTFLDRTLAMIYAVPAPARDGFGEAWLPEDGPRRGLLGQVSFLALQAHAVSTSATKRGIFVREVLLCETVPPPPADVNTSLPEPDANAATLRERIAVHLEVESCAGCHLLTDPIGLGLEQFDGLGLFRTTESGATIDPSGDLDGVPFADASALAGVLHDDPRFASCLADTVYSYAVGASVDSATRDSAVWLAQAFAEQGHSWQSLLRTVAMSRAFRSLGDLQ